MAKAKRKVISVTKKPLPKQTSRFPNFLLGLTFVIIILLLGSLFFRNNTADFSFKSISKLFTRSNSPVLTETVTPTPANDHRSPGEDYIVKKGDTIWKIAEEAYGSGYNAYDIIRANKLQNPKTIEVGQHIILPKVGSKMPTRGEVVGQAKVTGVPSSAPSEAPSVNTSKTDYVVQRGDCLWTIAEKKYGDGFKWTLIAQANNLANPRIIHAGNRLIIPS